MLCHQFTDWQIAKRFGDQCTGQQIANGSAVSADILNPNGQPAPVF